MIEIDTICVKNRWPHRALDRMMTAQDVLTVVGALHRAGIPAWLDGGWGVDALLGEQTRPHDDLDCVIALADAPKAIAALAPAGFEVADDALPTRCVVRGLEDRRVDLHTVTFDDDGGGVQQLQDGTSWRYPPAAFLAAGSVAGRSVACVSPEVQILAHLGYEPDEKDFRDMNRLSAQFGIPLPAPYGVTPRC